MTAQTEPLYVRSDIERNLPKKGLIKIDPPLSPNHKPSIKGLDANAVKALFRFPKDEDGIALQILFERKPTDRTCQRKGINLSSHLNAGRKRPDYFGGAWN